MGLAFFDLNDTSKTWVYQYDVSPLYDLKILDFVRPIATLNEKTKLYDFKWLLDVTPYARDDFEIKKCGWETQTVVANNVPGNLLNQWGSNYSQWFKNTYDMYHLFEFRYADNLEKYLDMSANSCHDYVFWGLQAMQNQYGIQLNGKTTSRLHGYFRLDRAHPEYNPRKLDVTNKEDNEIIYNFFKVLQDVHEIIGEFEFAKQYYSGKLFETLRLGWPTLKLVWILGEKNDYWQFQTDSAPYIWYQELQETVPGTD